MGKDHTIYSLIDGVVNFSKGRKNRSMINVLPLDDLGGVVETAAPAPKAEAKSEEAPAEDAAEETGEKE
jgi:large subunit ribosomal protein L27